MLKLKRARGPAPLPRRPPRPPPAPRVSASASGSARVRVPRLRATRRAGASPSARLPRPGQRDHLWLFRERDRESLLPTRYVHHTWNTPLTHDQRQSISHTGHTNLARVLHYNFELRTYFSSVTIVTNSTKNKRPFHMALPASNSTCPRAAWSEHALASLRCSVFASHARLGPPHVLTT